MKHFFLFAYLFFGSLSNAQNWSVFNSAYRYNYLFDNATIISNVLFADTTKLIGSDTVLSLNRIALKCDGRCFGTSIQAPNGSIYFIKDLPQFLQRKIQKSANGWTRLYDTTAMNFSPSGQINQSWIFDSVHAVTAVIVSKGIRNVLGTNDSVRTILLNSVDTIVLSKNFGIVVFPQPYAKNKYYRLSGIERNRFYDQTALCGAKVPNGWDIYDFQVGDVFCHEMRGMGHQETGFMRYYYAFIQVTIKAKTTTANGYDYVTDQYQIIVAAPDIYSLGSTNSPGNYYNSKPLIYDIRSNQNLAANSMYPNQFGRYVAEWGYRALNSTSVYNVGRFGKSSDGTFYKYTGTALVSGLPTNSISGVNNFTQPVPLNPNICLANASLKGSAHLGVSYGVLSSSSSFPEESYDSKVTCFTRNNVSVFGNKIVGMDEENIPNTFEVWPNPIDKFLNVNCTTASTLCIRDATGRLIGGYELMEPTTINTSDLPEGIYFISLQSQGGISAMKKLVIAH